MAKKPTHSTKSKTQVNLRLFTADVEEAKRRADEEGMPYQLWLRLRIHEWLRADEEVV